MILTIAFILVMLLWGLLLVTEPRSKQDILSYIAAVITGFALFGYRF